MKKIWLILALLFAISLPVSFAVETDVDDTGGYIPFLFVNNNYYDIDEADVLYDYDGIYFTPALYKDAYNLDIVRTGDTWTISKDGKTLGQFKHTDKIQLDDAVNIERAWTAENKTDYLLLEGILDILGEDFTYSWGLISDPTTDSREIKLIHTFVPETYCNMDKVEYVAPVLKVGSVDKLKTTNSYIKKMTKNPAKINKANNTITYSDASGSLIITLNINEDITVSHTGKLSQTALDLISLAYNDTLDKAASKEALTEIKRISALMNNKAKAAEIKKIEKRDFVEWYFFGDDGFYKWSYEFNTVQGKKYLDFCITNFFLDTVNYYE